MFALLRPAGLSEFESENCLPVDAFSKKIIRKEENFPAG